MDTIAAISTPTGNGGIGIIRISGNDAKKIINKIFVTNKNKELIPNSFKLGYIRNINNETIDQVLVSYFKAPKSYTGEDVCEINSHGGSVVLKQILELVLNNGARLAEAGEFTKRAFLNGKMDLTQAESVMDIISSKSAKEEKASAAQLEGKLGNEIRNIKDNIISLLADIEANIDYPEYEDIEEVKEQKVLSILNTEINRLDKLEKSFDAGKILKNGISTAIIGKPNVGKSSLLNVLLKEERAIVTDIPGTTRDTIEEMVTLSNGITLKLVDTAGIRETTDIVENIGVEKSKRALDEAELVLFLVDGSAGINDEDRKLYNMIVSKPHIVIVNKIDLDCVKTNLQDNNMVMISTKTGEGIDKLEECIEKVFNIEKLEDENQFIIMNIRHKDLIAKAKCGLLNAVSTVNSSMPMDIISIDIKEAIDSLGEILGESISDDILEKVFKKFCVGK